jgi:hypothetical protein
MIRAATRGCFPAIGGDPDAVPKMVIDVDSGSRR